VNDQTAEPQLTGPQKAYNVAQSEMFQLAAYGHHRYHPSGEALTDEGKRQQRDYNDRIRAAREQLEATLLRLVAEHAETFTGKRVVSVEWLRSLADDPAALSLLAVRPDERDFDTDPAAIPAGPAPATDPNTLREQIAALFRHPPGVERLGDATPGEIADAVLAELPAPTDQTAVARVRSLHQQYRFAGDDTRDYCSHCNQISGGWIPWPCPTVQALDGEQATELRRLAGEAQQDGCGPACSEQHTYGDHCEAQQEPTQDGEPVCIVAGCGHAELAHTVGGCRDCPRGQRAVHLFSLAAVARPGQPETDEDDDNPPVQCWHIEPNTPCDWNICRQPERLAAGDRGTDPADEKKS
jgi:hypothetical protein